jgi:hypothetical protein
MVCYEEAKSQRENFVFYNKIIFTNRHEWRINMNQNCASVASVATFFPKIWLLAKARIESCFFIKNDKKEKLRFYLQE